MINKSKIALIAALAVGIASPAFAQSYNKGDGTANELPFAYGIGGSKPAYEAATVVHNQQTSVRESGHSQAARSQVEHSKAEHSKAEHSQIAAAGTRRLYNYAPIGAAPLPNADSSAATGGGSAGYNAMVETY